MPAHRGASLIEAVVGVAVAGLLAAMLGAAASESRRQAGLTQNLSNLQQFAAGTSSYTLEHGDRYWGFSWRQGHVGPFDVAETELQAMADQAVDIMQRLGGATLERQANWYPGPHYSHLTLLEHVGSSITPEFVVAPEDAQRRLWQSDPFNIANLPPDQRPDTPDGSVQRWGFSSSYELGPAFQEADAHWTHPIHGRTTTVDQHGQAHDQWYFPRRRFGSRFTHEVDFPTHKVMMFERYERHFGPRDRYFMDPEARVPLLFADGAAAVPAPRARNVGFRPNSPRTVAPTLVRYEPRAWEPPLAQGRTAITVQGFYRWTRGGLSGRDVGSLEIDTSGW